MGLVTIDARDKTPIYAQLERGLRAAIAAGELDAFRAAFKQGLVRA